MNWENEFKLRDDLSDYMKSCGFLTFTEIDIRGCEGGRVDVAVLKPGMYATKDFRAYEVKNTRQCLLADIRANKWKKYFQVFHRVYFAIPEGIAKKEDIPNEVGLFVRNDNGWHVVKAAKGHTPPMLTADAVFSLLYRGYEDYRKMRRLSDRIIAEENIPLKEKAISIGGEISRRLSSERVTEVEEWTYDIVKVLSKAFDIEIKYNEDGFVKLPSKYHFIEAIQGIGSLMKDYKVVDLIGLYLSGIGSKYAQKDKEKLLEFISAEEQL